MTNLKCKYCGGSIAALGKDVGKCESCGCLVTFPKVDKQSSIELYNRADHLRKIHDYDGAISAYEHIAAENPTDPEARWNLVLCKYGVEYTYDRRTDRYLPTINRMSLDSILEDRDYLMALEYSDEGAKEEYRRQALKLAAIQDELEKIVRVNENYDVFISFKATDENRKRTRDYFLAQEIYDALSASGLRVFFSPVSLRIHAGEVYEPYIFAALYSSKVMILVGTKREYLDSEWVKNEWSRYLFMTRSNSQKHILPVYEGMKPEEFPAEIGKMQAISMNAVGALERIKERVAGYTAGEEKRIFLKNTAGERQDFTNQIRRLSFAVEDGDFKDAVNRIQKLRSEISGKNADIEYLALLAKYQAKDETELSEHIDRLQEDEDYQWLLAHGSEEQKQSLVQLAKRRSDSLQRKYEAQLLARLSNLYQNNRYRDIVQEVEAAQKKGAFQRSAEIDDFYQWAKKKYEYEILLERYRDTVGDGKTYFLRRLGEKEPNRAGQLRLLKSKTENVPSLSLLDQIVGLSWCAGLAMIALWFFLKGSLSPLVLMFDIALYVIDVLTYRSDKKESAGRVRGRRPYILLPSLPVFVATVIITAVRGDLLRPFNLFLLCGQLFGDGTADDGLMVYFYLVVLVFLIFHGIRIGLANGAAVKKKAGMLREKKELLEFLKHFEKQEELLLAEEFAEIDATDRIPLESLWEQ